MMAIALQLLLLPVHLMLVWLFLWVRSGTVSKSWRYYDWSVVAAAFMAWVVAATWGQAQVVAGSTIWPYVLSVLSAYLAFNAVLWGGWLWRRHRAQG